MLMAVDNVELSEVSVFLIVVGSHCRKDGGQQVDEMTDVEDALERCIFYSMEDRSPPLQLTDRAGDKFIGQGLQLDTVSIRQLSE